MSAKTDNGNLTVAGVQARVEEILEWWNHYATFRNAAPRAALKGQQDDLVAEVLLSIANMGQISGGQWSAEMASAARQVYRIGVK
jgi:hypothetical protein